MNAWLKALAVIFPVCGILAILACSSAAFAVTPGVAVLQLFKKCEIERDIPYSDCDVSLKMDIYSPAGKNAPVPAIIYVHGGGWYSGDKETGIGRYEIAPLVARGYLVAAINYRLAPRYKFPDQIEDVQSAVRFLRANAARYSIDPSNIGALGESAGGHLVALLGLTGGDAGFWKSGACYEQSDRVQAVVDMYGPADLTLTFQREPSLLLEHVFGTDDPVSDIVREASPVTYVSPDAPPFLIIHGDKDNTVLPEQSQELYQRLISSGVPASLIMVKNAGHSFVPVSGPISPTRSEINDSIAAFFDRYLKNGDSAQYGYKK